MATALTELRLFGPSGPALAAATWAPSGVRGADKVAARVAYFLLTPQGSVPGRPDDGTPFVELARAFRSEFDVFAAFAASEPALTASVRAAESPSEGDSERFGSVSLASVTVAGGLVTLALAVKSADGSSPSDQIDVTLEL